MIKDWKDSFYVQPVPLIFLFAVLQLFFALFTESIIFTHEEAMWHYIGRNWFRHGLTPYAGGVDNKSPLIFAVFGLSDILFGVNNWFPRLLGTFCQSIGIYFVYRIGKHLADERAGILAVSIYGLSLLWRSTGGKYVSFTETYAVTFVIIAFYYSLFAERQKGFIISGVLAGIAFAFRFSAFFGILALFILLIKKGILPVITFSLGAFISIASFLFLMHLSGIDLYDFIFMGFTDNFGRGSVTDHDISWKLEQFGNAFFYSELILLYPGLVAFFFFNKRNNPLLIWLSCAFIGVSVLGIYARNHLKDILPPLSVINAISFSFLSKNYKIEWKPILIVIWIVMFPKTFEPLYGLKKLLGFSAAQPGKYCKMPFLQPDDYSKKKLGLWIKSNTKPMEKVLVGGMGAQVQVYSERLSPTIYFNATQTQRAKKRFFKDVAVNRPGMIVVPKFPEYEKYIDGDIRIYMNKLLVTNYSYDSCMYGYGIYRWKDNGIIK